MKYERAHQLLVSIAESQSNTRENDPSSSTNSSKEHADKFLQPFILSKDHSPEEMRKMVQVIQGIL